MTDNSLRFNRFNPFEIGYVRHQQQRPGMSFFQEIKRRKVFHVTVVYLVVAWLIMQVVDVVNEPWSLPDWFDTVVILIPAIGFLVAVMLSWAYDITPEGVVRTDCEPGSSQTDTQGAERSRYGLVAIGALLLGALPEQKQLSNLGDGLPNCLRCRLRGKSVYCPPCNSISP